MVPPRPSAYQAAVPSAADIPYDPGMLWPIELASALILGLFLALMARGGLRSARPGRQSFSGILRDVGLIAALAWCAEVLSIRLFGFYQYDAPWLLFLDVMPALVALIWPFVILSARELAVHLGLESEGRPSAAAVFAIVLYDASLVEPVAVAARLWSWNEPGIFGVPPIGILGWAFFAAAVSFLLDRAPRALLLAPLLVQGLLVAAWWGLFRWVLREAQDPTRLAAASALVALILAIWVLRSGRRAPLAVMIPRMAAAALFFVLLFLRGREVSALIPYGASFALPYLAATRFKARS